jgi:hypothetical protein
MDVASTEPGSAPHVLQIASNSRPAEPLFRHWSIVCARRSRLHGPTACRTPRGQPIDSPDEGTANVRHRRQAQVELPD